ncbi:MAG: hypothetical protein HQ478_13730 [Chloroflexi bacterium]|nr:hypothetical protein [Chloroflexota bacterium]
MPDLLLLTSSETVSLIRDILIIVFIVLAIISLAFVLVYGVLILRKLNRLLDKLENLATSAEGVLETLQGVGGSIRPISAITSVGGFAARMVRKVWG